MITVKTWDLVLTLPAPTQILESHRELNSAQERVVTRNAAVTERPDVGLALLDFEAVPGGPAVNGLRSGALTILVRHIRGATTVERARAHFFSERGPEDQERFERRSGAITVDEFEDFSLVGFNSARAGWMPGNIEHSLVLKKFSGAFVIQPTHFLEFDWAAVSVRKRR